MNRIILIGALCVLVVTAASAADVKSIKFTTPIVIDGIPSINEIKCPVIPATGKRDCQTPFTVGELAYMSLEKPQDRGQTPLSWTDAIKHDDLARAVRNAEAFPLLEDQRIMIESALASAGFSNAVLGFIKDVIDPSISAASTQVK
jgi:hypothetical protein